MLGDLFGRQRLHKRLERSHLRSLFALFSVHFENKSANWVATAAHDRAIWVISLVDENGHVVELDDDACALATRHLNDLRRLQKSPTSRHWNAAVFRMHDSEMSMERNDWK